MNQTVINILIIVAALAIIAAAVIVLINVLRIQGKGRQYKYKLALLNAGNVATRFDLKAEDGSGMLQFQFAMNGAPLGGRPLRAATPVKQAPARGARSEPQPTQPPSGVKKAAGAAMGAEGVIADMLMSVGYILPGSIGRPLVSLASQMRYGEYAANRVGNVQNQVQQLGKIGQSSGGTYVGGSVGPLPPASVAVQPAAQTQTVAIAPVDAWTQTPVVAPGGTLALDLLVTPLKANHTQRCTFSVASRAIEDPAAQLVSESSELELTGTSLMLKLVPWVVFAVVVVGTLACSALFIMGNRG